MSLKYFCYSISSFIHPIKSYRRNACMFFCPGYFCHLYPASYVWEEGTLLLFALLWCVFRGGGGGSSGNMTPTPQIIIFDVMISLRFRTPWHFSNTNFNEKKLVHMLGPSVMCTLSYGYVTSGAV